MSEQKEKDAKVLRTDEEWRASLTPEQYAVARRKGTERPFTGQYYHNDETGMYHCVCCGAELFRTDDQFDAGCGWPSFTQPTEVRNVRFETDRSHGMVRTEVLCDVCDAHLGHVFDDGPGPSGQRYCINSVCLDFKKR
ncbi:MAG: peptide-methionine (R)-S-oxide reductase MsrB [Candidatus Eisenbacteria bacterium]|uniref:Peptide methionine sulfoxide reductase MsrB n=1 Tax=Eiseniibacteriota bacterium TaxID=2212470 RepID=A0A956LX41_UNCEI|nr:peptide-methionine (R)-S-oxide reductase MsrB [Candidatus Eisenbacteria bacterium]